MSANVLAPAAMLVGLVALVGAFLLFLKMGYPKLQAFVTKIVTKHLPPSWPRPPTEAGTSSPTSSPTTPPPPSEDPTEPVGPPTNCPDGSGGCPTDDTPVVAPVAYPPACKDVNSDTFRAWAAKEKWGYGATPIIGPIWKSMDMVIGNGDPMQKIMDQVQQASMHLEEASAQWQNAYFKFLGVLAKDILPATQVLMDPHKGLVQLTAETAALPLNHAAYMLVAPVLSLLVCSAILVWAI